MALASAERVGQLSVDFDGEGDVLYIHLGPPVASHVDEGPRGLLFRWANADDRPSGITVLDFRANWPDQLGGLYSVVARHLQLPVQLVEREISRALASPNRLPVVSRPPHCY
jgi:hypothetical protein